MYLDGVPVPSAGRRILTVARGAAVVLMADNGHGDAVTRVLVPDPSPAQPLHLAVPARVLLSPRVRGFTARPDPGTGRVILQWATTDASRVTLDGSTVAPVGRRLVPASSPARHVLIASSLLGVDATTLDVPPVLDAPVLRVSSRPPAIPEFILEHRRSGQPYTLRWRTIDAANVTLDGRAVTASGSLPLLPPLADHTFTLLATSADGATRARIRLQVQ